jgi:translation initiation factor IF-3
LAADGSQIGIISIEEARQKARETKADLVEISTDANPPVVKLINFKKFKYQEAKKDRASAKKIKKVDIKEIRLSPYIGENDLKIRTDRAREFLEDGNKVRLVVKFTGRQMSHQEFGFQVLGKAFDILSDVGSVELQPKMIGRQIISMVSPAKK